MFNCPTIKELAQDYNDSETDEQKFDSLDKKSIFNVYKMTNIEMRSLKKHLRSLYFSEN
jgi:hypothetical protein